MAQTDHGHYESLLDRVKKDPPHWANETIQPWDETLFKTAQPFVKEKYWSDRHSINVFTVIGTQHQDYIGWTWMKFLEQGKRMRQNLDLHRINRAYYFETALKKPAMDYISLDGMHYYIYGDGNHRTCIARFDFFYPDRLPGSGNSADGRSPAETTIMLHGVSVQDYRIDWTFFEIYQSLQEIIAEQGIRAGVEPLSRRKSREDTAGWMRETFETELRFKSYKDGKSQMEILNIESAQRKLDELKSKHVKRSGVLAGFFSRLRSN